MASCTIGVKKKVLLHEVGKVLVRSRKIPNDFAFIFPIMLILLYYLDPNQIIFRDVFFTFFYREKAKVSE